MTIRTITLTLAIMLASLNAQTSTKEVRKVIETNAITENLVVPTGKRVTINAGGEIVNNGTATGFGSGGVWGSITGTLTDQTDLVTALGLKANTSSLGALATLSIVGNSQITDGTISLAKLATDPLARANHTGTQALSTISDANTLPRLASSNSFTGSNTYTLGNSETLTVNGAGDDGLTDALSVVIGPDAIPRMPFSVIVNGADKFTVDVGGNVVAAGSVSTSGSLSGPTIISTGDMTAAYTGGNLILGGGATAGEFRMMEPSGSGTNYTGFYSPPLVANVIYEMPAADGSSGQVLKTNGSKVLSWVSQPTVSDTTYDATSWNANTDAPTKNAVRDKLESLSGSKVVQIIYVAKTDTASAAGTTWTTLMSGTITPTSASNKVVVIASLATGHTTGGGYPYFIRIARSGTALLQGDAAGSREVTQVSGYNAATNSLKEETVLAAESPASASALTYDIEGKTGNAGATLYLNRTSLDRNIANEDARGASYMLLIEVTP